MSFTVWALLCVKITHRHGPIYSKETTESAVSLIRCVNVTQHSRWLEDWSLCVQNDKEKELNTQHKCFQKF